MEGRNFDSEREEWGRKRENLKRVNTQKVLSPKDTKVKKK